MMKIEIRDLRIKVDAQYHRAGSILAGTASAGADTVAMEAIFNADAPEEKLRELVRMAEASCYTAGALREPVPLALSATINGEQWDLTS
jgi:hypothetical protein